MVDDIGLKKQEDIVGGLKNAMVRGETLDMARFSFLNAGYSSQIVNMAANSLIQKPTVVEQQVPVGQSPVGIVPSAGNLYAQRPPVVMPVVKKRGVFGSGVPYWVVILMILLTLGIVIGAGVLGLYWDSIF